MKTITEIIIDDFGFVCFSERVDTVLWNLLRASAFVCHKLGCYFCIHTKTDTEPQAALFIARKGILMQIKTSISVNWIGQKLLGLIELFMERRPVEMQTKKKRAKRKTTNERIHFTIELNDSFIKQIAHSDIFSSLWIHRKKAHTPHKVFSVFAVVKRT